MLKHTQVGIQKSIANDLYQMIESDEAAETSYEVFISFFEIYGGRCQDLLNNRNRLNVREDGGGKPQLKLFFLSLLRHTRIPSL